MGSSGTALGIIAIILAAGAIGFAFVVWNDQRTSNPAQTIVVGIWDSLEDNLDYAPNNLQNNWLFEFGDNTLNNTDYISLSNGNTRFTLLQPGWYRIHLSVALFALSVNSIYWVILLKDDTLESRIYRHEISTNFDSVYHYVDVSAFVYSDGTNYIEINGLSNGDNFNPNSADIYNQFTIEYVAI